MTFLPTAVLSALILAAAAGLDAPDRATWRRAQERLRDLAPHTLPTLLHLEKFGSPRQQSRAEQVLDGLSKDYPGYLAEAMRPASWPRLPWIDMLPEDYPERDAVLWGYLQRARGTRPWDGPPEWEHYRQATLLLLADRLRAGKTRQELLPLLNQMREVERTWIMRHGADYQPPIRLPGSRQPH